MQATNFDTALAASKQVAEMIGQLRQQVEKTVSEIDWREKELGTHLAAPLPESDLKTFFTEYVDVTAKKGQAALVAHLTTIIYPKRPATALPGAKIAPLSFGEMSAILTGDKTGTNAWLLEWLAPPIPDMRSIHPFNAGEVITYLLKSQIQEGLCRLLEERNIQYQATENCGLPMTERRARIAVLNAELLDLKSEKTAAETKISKLNGSK